MRVLGLDIGTRRIGVAVSDPSGVVAAPYAVLSRAKDRSADHRAVAELVAEVGAGRVVVGLPLSLNGRIGPAARQVLDEVEQLRAALPVPVECHDERLSTVSAQRSLREAGTRASARRAVVDKVAAAVLLQSWLDGQDGDEGET
ncbi:MAG: Holliday junction resolvase RuvX [Actinomycetota bacterium]|nr:Holliday junction resolvase RuvX [Actinomycetota bacterium]